MVKTVAKGKGYGSKSLKQKQDLEELTGAKVRKSFRDEATGKQKVYSGVVEFLGPKAWPHCFHVVYSDGDAEDMTYGEVQKHLVSLAKQQPKKASPMAKPKRTPSSSKKKAAAPVSKGKGSAAGTAPSSKKKASSSEDRLRALAGSEVKKSFRDPVSGKQRLFVGVVEFLGAEEKPHYFRVVYDDGDEETMTYKQVLEHQQKPKKEAAAAVGKAKTKVKVKPSKLLSKVQKPKIAKGPKKAAKTKKSNAASEELAPKGVDGDVVL